MGERETRSTDRGNEDMAKTMMFFVKKTNNDEKEKQPNRIGKRQCFVFQSKHMWTERLRYHHHQQQQRQQQHTYTHTPLTK